MYKSLLVAVLFAGSALAHQNFSANQLTVHLSDPSELAPTKAFFFSSVGPFGPPVTGAPYSAQAETERLQTLTDGNRIQQTTTSSIARDSQGRTRMERTVSGMKGPSGEPPALTTIEDPVAGFNYTLDPANKIAFKSHAGRGGAIAIANGQVLLDPVLARPAPDGAMNSKQVEPFQVGTKTGGKPDADTTKSDLGFETMEGVLVQGTRITRTIPAGAIGNEQPIIITSETWFSPDLKVLVMSKSDDPRMGETTYKLTRIQRAEPSATLFEVPSDYTIREGPGPNVVFNQKLAPGNAK